MFVTVKIWDYHGNRLRAGPAVLKALTEAWTGTSLMERCGRIVIFPDENPGTSGVRSPDEHSNESRMTLCRSGSSGAVRVSSEGTRFLTMLQHKILWPEQQQVVVFSWLVGRTWVRKRPISAPEP